MTSSPSTGRGFQLLLRGSALRFTLQRDPDRRLSACSDGPSGRDVDGRVHVGMRSEATGKAPEDRLALTILWGAMPAVAAGLRRVRGVDFLDPSGSLVLQTAYQATPAVGEDRPVETSFCSASVRQVGIWAFGVGFGFGTPGQLNDSQVFNTDDVESPRKLGAGLLDPVLAPVPCPSEQLRDRRLHLAASGGAAATAGEAALQALEPSLFSLGQLGTQQQFSGREGRRYNDTTVDADDSAGTGRWNRRRDNSEGDVPVTQPIAGDAVRLCRWDRSSQAEPDPTDFRDEYRGPLPVQPDHPGCLATDDAESLALSGFAPGRSAVGAGVEALGCSVEVAQRLLLDSLGSCSKPVGRSSCLGQLPTLLGKGRCRALIPSPHRPLFKRQVPDVPGMPALLEQVAPLHRRGVHAEPRHAIDPISRYRQFRMSEWRTCGSSPV